MCPLFRGATPDASEFEKQWSMRCLIRYVTPLQHRTPKLPGRAN